MDDFMRRSDILIIDIAQSRYITPVENANTARIMKHNTVEIETKRYIDGNDRFNQSREGGKRETERQRVNDEVYATQSALLL